MNDPVTMKFTRPLVSANKAMRMHWRYRSNLTRIWMRLILAAYGHGPWPKFKTKVRNSIESQGAIRWVPAGVWPAKEKRRATFLIYRRKLQDADNATACLKPILDALVRAGWLVDDGMDWCELFVLQERCKKGEEKLLLRLQ